jgi:hypothetical protein
MSEPARYDAQNRGDAADYASYFAGMDKTMRQKLAFVGAHLLLDPGSRIADMGCGSGSGSYQLAVLNPQLHVIGVDITPNPFVSPAKNTSRGTRAEPGCGRARPEGVRGRADHPAGRARCRPGPLLDAAAPGAG